MKHLLSRSVSVIGLIIFLWMPGTVDLGGALAQTGKDQPEAPTTIIILRHAEKSSDSGNTNLSPAGKIRALMLAHVCGSSGLAAIYGVTSNGNDIRVRETLEPIATHLKMEPKIKMITNQFDFKILRHDIRTNYSGKVLLIVSNSDFIGKIIKTLGGDEAHCSIGGDYDNLCVVTMCAAGSVNVVKLKYGTTKEILTLGGYAK